MSTPTHRPRIAYTPAPPVPGRWQWRRIADAIAADPAADDPTIARRTRLARAHVAHVRARLPPPAPPAPEPAIVIDSLAAPLAPLADADETQPCRHCGRRCKLHKNGLGHHERTCPQNPERRPHTRYDSAGKPRPPAGVAASCLRCRLELPSPKRLELHVATAHAGEALAAPVSPAPPEPPVLLAPTTPALGGPPTCGCAGPFARDPADERGRCLKCSGAYARSLERRSTSYRAAYAAAD